MVSELIFAKLLEILTTGSLEIGKFPPKQSASIFRETARALHLTSFFDTTGTQRQNDCACSAIFACELACSVRMEARGENEASFSPNFKPSVDGNEFYYLKRHWDFDRDASGVIFRKLQTVGGL